MQGCDLTLRELRLRRFPRQQRSWRRIAGMISAAIDLLVLGGTEAVTTSTVAQFSLHPFQQNEHMQWIPLSSGQRAYLPATCNHSHYCSFMSDTEQQSVIHVRNTLKLFGVQGEVRRLDDSARTAQEAADALGIEVGQIANSLIFLADGNPVLVMASGKHRVNTNSVAAALEATEVTKASAEDVRAATGYAIGGVAPVGHPEQLPTIVDISLSQYDEVWAAAGHPHCVFPTTYDELLRITGGHAAEISV